MNQPPRMPVRIRPATAADTAGMFAVSVAAHSSGYESMVPVRSYPRFQRRFAATDKNQTVFTRIMNARLTNPLWTVLVAETEGRIVGYHCARRTGGIIVLRGLFVDPAYQGQGIGKTLFAALVNKFGSEILEFKVLKANGKAISLYRQFGFVTTRRLANRFFGAPQVIMRRNNRG